VALLAVSAGATVAPLNPAYRTSEFEFYLADLDAKALIVELGSESPAIGVAQRRRIPIFELSRGLEEEAGKFALTGARPLRPALGFYAQADDIALVLHTSGTTSRPKLVPLTHRNICISAWNIQNTLRLIPSDRCLNVMPLFHIHGLIGAVLSSLTSGASVVCTPGPKIPTFFKWMDEFKPTWYTAAPTIHHAILSAAAGHREIIARSPMRFIRSCSSPLPPQTMLELERTFNAPVIESYGMTEASHQITSNPLPPHRRKVGSVGLPAGSEVAILSESGRLLKTCEIGEIAIRGATVTLGYENDSNVNGKTFTSGWLRTGDQGYLDSEGYLFITSRLKEIINRGAEKISPREVDEALLGHPGVAQAVTFAVPHATLGEEVAAAVVLHKGSVATEKEIREFAVTRLADFKVPRKVLILDELPQSATGKAHRIGLAEKLGLTLPSKDVPEQKKVFIAPRDVLEAQLVKVWEKVLNLMPISVADNFFDLGGNSLSAAYMFHMIAKITNNNLPLATLFQAPTIEQLAAILRHDGAGEPWTSLTAIQPKGSKPPLFCLHWDNGTVFFYRDLAAHLDPDQPVYGLQAVGLDGKKAPHTSTEDMAAHYIREIQTVQPEGPYFLIGRCYGGFVAFEMAHQLHTQGWQATLIILDSGPIDWQSESFKDTEEPPSRYFHRFFYHLKRKQLTHALLLYLLTHLKKVARKMNRMLSNPYNCRLQSITDANLNAKKNYRAKPYPGRIMLYRSEEFHTRKDKDWHLKWSELAAGGFDCELVSGTHMTMLHEPHVRILAKKLTAYLEHAQSTDSAKKTLGCSAAP
jgi:acyl-CoA synthetase (AMP-forming)/AMP-acid ligase II/thioesterase domain-containing protein